MPAAAKPAGRSSRDAGRVEHKSIPLEVKAVRDPGDSAATSPGGEFEGIGGCFLNIDAQLDIVAPGAFKADIAEFLSDGFIGGVNHNWNNPIGHPYEAKEVERGIAFKAVFEQTPDAQVTREKMKVNPRTGRATIRRLSIGYRIKDAELLDTESAVRSFWRDAKYTPSDQDLERLAKAMSTPLRNAEGKVLKDKAGKDRVTGVRLLKRLSLYEISPVAVPANERTEITGAKYYGPGPERNADGTLNWLGDTDAVIAWTAMSRLHDMLCSALYQILSSEVIPPDARLGQMGEAIDQFRDALLPMMAYFLRADPEGGDGLADAGDVGAAGLAKQFRARFGLGFDEASFAAKLGAGSAAGFADQSRSVVSAAEGFADRAEARVEARLKDGRGLSAAHRDALRRCREGLKAQADAIGRLLERAAEPGDAPDAKEATTPETDGAKAARVDPEAADAAIRRHQDTTKALEWERRLKGYPRAD